MLIEDVAKLTPEERFVYWVTERESIRKLKSRKRPKPWTDDEILQRYRFCNVRRMDDKVSQWLLKNWYEPNFDHPNMLIACALARFFNLPSTLEHIGFPKTWCPANTLNVLHELEGSIFNGAYVIYAGSVKGASKTDTIIDAVISPLTDVTLDTSSIQLSVERLTTCTGFGWFMAGQVVADIRWAVSGDWFDRKSWAAPGPGSLRGISRVLGRRVSRTQFFIEFPLFIKRTKDQLPKLNTQRLEAIDYQNCLCEFDKYERTLWGEGKPKMGYNGQ